MINKKALNAIYGQYGFVERPSGEKGVCVYTLRAGHFHNADIIPLNDSANIEKVFSDFKVSGYACKIRNYVNITDVENSLFKGFFTVSSTKSRLIREYNKFTESIVSAHSDEASYSYIETNYYINEKKGVSNAIDEIKNRLDLDKPILFLIEAAAGYGKTCTVYELLKNIVDEYDSKIPLFSELSRNRQAKIFRYVLLDEIDRSFPLLSSILVRSEVKKGNVPVILDGFDELLHKSQDKDGYENTEPMLDTVGELLTNKAKIILTTRRTAIFDGDEFHDWMDSHEEDFEVVRIRIDEPTVSAWIPDERYKSLKKANFPIDKLSNPVLLSYLRYIPDCEFEKCLLSSDSIVNKYFESMLERERVRQDLRMQPNDQYEVLKSIAHDMVEFNYTAESKEYIIEVINSLSSSLIEKTRKAYPVEDRPTTDELLNKLASHALLDRSSDNSQDIGFVNEFVLGNFCSDIILEEPSGEWAGDPRFIEPAVLAYQPRSQIRRHSLWLSVKFSLAFVNFSQYLDSMVRLTGEICSNIESESIENICLSNLRLSPDILIKDSVFFNCSFIDVTFDPSRLDNVSFLNSEFYNCMLVDTKERISEINLLGCTADKLDFLESFNVQKKTTSKSNLPTITGAEKFILEKYWPKGRQTFTKHKPIKSVCAQTNHFKHAQVLDAINSLKKRKFLVQSEKASFLEINLSLISEIKTALGK